MKVTHGSLFSGIGGIDLGFEWAGIETRWQVEIDEYCQKLLSIRFPHNKKFTDVRKVGSHNLEKVDIISGGFPCQDISVAGKGAGIEGERSGLWTELHRVVSELRPRFAFIENVPMLTIRGGGRVIADLAEIGYDAEWQIVGADDVGAWHRRKRIWIVAYPRDSSDTAIKRQEKEKDRISEVNRTGRSSGEFSRTSGSTKVLADTNRTGDRTSKSRTNRDRQKEDERRKGQSQSESGRYGEDISNTNKQRLERYRGECELGESGEEVKVSRESNATNSNSSRSKQNTSESKLWANRAEQSSTIKRIPDKTKSNQKSERRKDGLPDTSGRRIQRYRKEGSRPELQTTKSNKNDSNTRSRPMEQSWWAVEPNVGRVAHGIPNRVDRLKGLGNAIVPQVAALIMERIKNID